MTVARLLYSDPGSHLVYQLSGRDLGNAVGRVGTLYEDAAGTVLADIAEYVPATPNTPGPVIASSQLTVDSTSRLPWFWGPASGLDTLYVTVHGGPLTLINAYYDPRIDAAIAGGGVNSVTAGAGLTGGGTGAVNLAADLGTTNTSVATYGQIAAALMLLTSGEEFIPRRLVNSEESMNPGTLHLTYTIARKTETITQLFTVSGNASAGATLAQIGIYSIDANTFAGTLIAFTPAAATLWSSPFTTYTLGLNTPWNKVAGTLYAAGFLFTGASAPQVECCNVRYGSAAFAPRIQGQLPGQVAMPGSFTNGSLSESFQDFQLIALP